MRFLPSVNEEVFLQTTILVKWLVALKTIVPLDSTVGLLVIEKTTATCKRLGTLITRLSIWHLYFYHLLFPTLSLDDWWKNINEDKLQRFVTFPFYNKSLFGLKISDALILFCEILLQTRSNHAWPAYLPDLAARHTYLTLQLWSLLTYLWFCICE